MRPKSRSSAKDVHSAAMPAPVSNPGSKIRSDNNFNNYLHRLTVVHNELRTVLHTYKFVSKLFSSVLHYNKRVHV